LRIHDHDLGCLEVVTLIQEARLTVDADTLLAYAELTDDFNPIHLDSAFAAATPMGGIIAHGTMSICLLWQALHRSFGSEVLTMLDLDVRFIKPVREGETIVAAGVANPDKTDVYDVWVKGEDGSKRMTGTVRLLRSAVEYDRVDGASASLRDLV
jgi:3-hydroxybutyryl-CoA dehydratase